MDGNAEPAGKEPLEVAIIGAGFAGICMGIRLRQAGIGNFRIFEKTGGVSGTWWDNTYPGAACDVPSHLYSFSFELNPDWSRHYAPQAEIHAYAERCVDRYGLRRHIRHHVEIAAARWDDAAALWRLATADGEEIAARVAVSAVGALNRPNIPDIPGMAEFAGAMFHSARWDHDCELAGKRVAIIGSAASAVQIAPQIAPQVERLTIFQRTANYIAPREDRAYGEDEKARFRRSAWRMRLHRWANYWRMEWRYLLFRRDSGLGRKAAEFTLRHMRRLVKDRALREKLTPDYPIGCKRILISDDFYQTLLRDNVDLETVPIERFVPEGIVTAGGRTVPADVIVLATGFRATDFLQALDVTGAGGLRLADAWREGMQAYRGVAVAGFPNFFILLGPNTGLGHNSIIFMIERQVDYVMKCLKRLRGHRSIMVEGSAMRRFNEAIQRDLQDTVWAAGCHSWYKTPDGRIPTLWPYTTVRYWWTMRRPDFRDFVLTG